MADFSIYVALVAQALSDDPALNVAVDGKIISGFNRNQADQHLRGSHACCVGVRSVDLQSQGLPGCAYHGLSIHDQLIEFHLIARGTDDSYLAGVADLIQKIMKKPIVGTMHGTAYNISTYGPIRFKPVDDDQFSDRVQITGTCRLKYLDE